MKEITMTDAQVCTLVNNAVDRIHRRLAKEAKSVAIATSEVSNEDRESLKNILLELKNILLELNDKSRELLRLVDDALQILGRIVSVIIAISCLTTAHAATVTFAWDPPDTGATPEGYRLYRIALGQTNVITSMSANARSAGITPIATNQVYFLTAFTALAGEGPPSNFVALDMSAPGAPLNFRRMIGTNIVQASAARKSLRPKGKR